MTTTTTRTITAAIATICFCGSWSAPADATTHSDAGRPTASAPSDIDAIIAQRKTQTAQDYITFATERAASAAPTDPRRPRRAGR